MGIYFFPNFLHFFDFSLFTTYFTRLGDDLRYYPHYMKWECPIFARHENLFSCLDKTCITTYINLFLISSTLKKERTNGLSVYILKIIKNLFFLSLKRFKDLKFKYIFKTQQSTSIK